MAKSTGFRVNITDAKQIITRKKNFTQRSELLYLYAWATRTSLREMSALHFLSSSHSIFSPMRFHLCVFVLIVCVYGSPLSMNCFFFSLCFTSSACMCSGLCYTCTAEERAMRVYRNRPLYETIIINERGNKEETTSQPYYTTVCGTRSYQNEKLTV